MFSYDREHGLQPPSNLLFFLFYSYTNCCLGTLNSFLSITKSICVCPSFWPELWDPIPQDPQQKQESWTECYPSSFKGNQGLALEISVYCSYFAPGSFSFLLFYSRFKGESPNWSLGSRTCCGLCQRDLVAVEVFLSWAQGLGITIWILATKA